MVPRNWYIESLRDCECNVGRKGLLLNVKQVKFCVIFLEDALNCPFFKPLKNICTSHLCCFSDSESHSNKKNN